MTLEEINNKYLVILTTINTLHRAREIINDHCEIDYNLKWKIYEALREECDKVLDEAWAKGDLLNA